ncbi:MAG: Mlc titration factor MtfA (ptsG expression regulator) [Saprospiraceae bacterium]|jgi:Mlc titration factor MtfA (ptsG expression regulator)
MYQTYLLQQSDDFSAIAGVFGILLFIAVIAAFFFIVKTFLMLMFDSATSKAIGSKMFRHASFGLKKLSPERTKILNKHFPYYQKLPAKSKRIFESRVNRFCALKSFEPKEGLIITDEMKIFVGASAVQLTFGLRDFRFLHFDRIEIYPEKFYSKKGRAYHLGETDPRGRTLRFSWADFVKGYAIGDDNRNLGLHEFSHALFLNYLSGKKDDDHFDEYYEVWKSEGSRQFFQLKKTQSTYIRKYATTNLMEFFAVCVECFFETPNDLFEFHPKIYNSIKKLLGQDPKVLLKQVNY